MASRSVLVRLIGELTEAFFLRIKFLHRWSEDKWAVEVNLETQYGQRGGKGSISFKISEQTISSQILQT